MSELECRVLVVFILIASVSFGFWQASIAAFITAVFVLLIIMCLADSICHAIKGRK